MSSAGTSVGGSTMLPIQGATNSNRGDCHPFPAPAPHAHDAGVALARIRNGQQAPRVAGGTQTTCNCSIYQDMACSFFSFPELNLEKLQTTIMEYLVVSSCTSRKRAPVGVGANSPRLSSLSTGGYECVANQWRDLVASSEPRYHPSLLYCGRTVTDALKATEALNAQLAFVSAGMGLVLDRRQHGEADAEKIPAYSLTVSPGNPDSVERAVLGEFSATSWWLALSKALGRNDRLKTLIEGDDCNLALMAMPASYIEMVSGELEAISSESLKKLRIFGPRRVADVPAFLRSAVMPYDDRLNAKKIGMSGTESDFAQRALLHFVRTIFPPRRSATQADHAEAITAFLGAHRFKRKAVGRKVTDDELRSLVRSLVPLIGTNRTAMLRHLRDKERIACEQTRFAKLMSTIPEFKK